MVPAAGDGGAGDFIGKQYRAIGVVEVVAGLAAFGSTRHVDFDTVLRFVQVYIAHRAGCCGWKLIAILVRTNRAYLDRVSWQRRHQRSLPMLQKLTTIIRCSTAALSRAILCGCSWN